MPAHPALLRLSGKRIRVPVPPTRDPFINNLLVPAGHTDTGEERFWITTWNSCVGCIGALVTATGAARIYRFPLPHAGFYSAVAEDHDTLWLCGDLSRMVRLDLRSGEFESFATGAPSALVFSGMPFDAATGKLLALAFPMSDAGPTAVSFDIRTRTTVQLHRNLAAAKYMRFSFPNGDGTWSCVLHIPGEMLLRWDPAAETVTPVPLGAELDSEDVSGGTTYTLIADDAGRRYLPGRGWYDPRSGAIAADGPRPAREMTWFARRGNVAWGCNREGSVAQLARWNLDTGAVRDLGAIPDSYVQGMNLTADGRIVAVNTYGEFFRFDAETGAPEVTRRLPTDACGAVDCLRRIDRDRLLGTPFITQRFWEVNLRTRRGSDCGRAAPGGGEILQTWKLNGRVYLAAYGGGELTEYDPAQPARFPENPRVVADPPGGMRPVAAADDGRVLFYSCSRSYGEVGSVMTRYDTETGVAAYRPDPLPHLQIQSLGFDAAAQVLVCGTTIHADCRSRAPIADACCLATLAPQTLAVRDTLAAPAGCGTAVIDGPVGPGRWLCRLADIPGLYPWWILDLNAWRLPPVAEMPSVPPAVNGILYAGRPGWFILRRRGAVELWDWRAEPQCRAVLCRSFAGHRVFADGESVYLAYAKYLVVLDGCLRGLR